VVVTPRSDRKPLHKFEMEFSSIGRQTSVKHRTGSNQRSVTGSFGASVTA
jgi:hypothetical protein